MVPEENLETLRERYQLRSNQELLADARHYDEMTEPAKVAFRGEFERRGLDAPMVYEWVPDEMPGSRSAPDPDKPVKLVTVARYRDLSEAIVARSVLEGGGISCFLFDENFVRLDWGYSNFIGGMRLQVDVADEADALELLRQTTPHSIAVPGAGAFDQPVCPRCGSDKIVAFDPGLKSAALTVLVGNFLSFFFLWPIMLWRVAMRRTQRNRPERWHCMNCSCNWADE